jgi:hypothetical protein
MVHPGFMGGELGYRLLRWLGSRAASETLCTGGVYARQSKLAVPIKRLRRFFTPLTRESLTSIVRCTLRPRPAMEPT